MPERNAIGETYSYLQKINIAPDERKRLKTLISEIITSFVKPNEP